MWPPKLWHSLYSCCDCWGGPSGTDSRGWWAHMISWLASSKSTASTGWTFPLTHGAFYFLILATILHTQVIMDLAQKPFKFRIKPVPFALSSMPRSHATCSLFLSVTALSLKNKCPLRCLRILCELKHRPKTEKWVLRAPNNLLTLFTHSGSQLLTFHMGYALPTLAHTLHKPLSSPFPGLFKQQQAL